jgi:hypothetical protein
MLFEHRLEYYTTAQADCQGGKVNFFVKRTKNSAAGAGT